MVISGADVVTGWIPVRPGLWKKDPWPYRFPTHPNDEAHRLIGRCEQVIREGRLVRQVAELTEMQAETFCADTEAQVLYLMLPAEVEHNNVKGFDKGWEGGGFKITHAREGVVRRSQAVANDGVGMWFDIDVRDVLVEQCFAGDNAGHGIYVKISGGFQIRNNLCVRNGRNP